MYIYIYIYYTYYFIYIYIYIIHTHIYTYMSYRYIYIYIGAPNSGESCTARSRGEAKSGPDLGGDRRQQGQTLNPKP